jgi:hypothetical protein
MPNRLPSTGDRFSNCRPESLPTNLLLMKWAKVRLNMAAQRYVQGADGSNENSIWPTCVRAMTAGAHWIHCGAFDGTLR